MKLTVLLIYGFLFFICFLISALIWHAQMANVYFVSQERGLIADFVPPFVHMGAEGEFYIRQPHVIYAVWAVYFGCVVLIPGICSWVILRFREHALNRAWK